MWVHLLSDLDWARLGYFKLVGDTNLIYILKGKKVLESSNDSYLFESHTISFLLPFLLPLSPFPLVALCHHWGAVGEGVKLHRGWEVGREWWSRLVAGGVRLRFKGFGELQCLTDLERVGSGTTLVTIWLPTAVVLLAGDDMWLAAGARICPWI
jgi:hypothetical protein